MGCFEIEDLSFAYPGREEESLKHVSLRIGAGEYVVLCGRSGSGKTTLLRHLKSVLQPHGRRSGSIRFCGRLLEEINEREQAATIGFVMQDPDDQIVTDRVWHELAFGLENLGCDKATMDLRIAEMADWFGIRDWLERDVALLSGGQKQLLNLASIMAMQPKVLILDEPTSQLDPIAAADFLATVRRINIELGTTVILTEHRLEDVFHHADRVLVMEEGRLTVDADPRTASRLLLQQENPLFAALPTPVRVFCRCEGEGEPPLTVREGRNWLSGSFARGIHTDSLPDAPAAGGAPAALRVKGAWFRYEKDAPDVLKGLELEVPQGCIFAIVGGNGAGKSTALKAVCGINRLYRGRVEVLGKPLKPGKAEQFSGCMAMLPQDPMSLFFGQTVLEDLQEMGAPQPLLEQTAQLCQIGQLLDRHPGELSGGEQQRCALAKVLLTNPKLLLLDEPTKGLDCFFKQQFARILRQLTKQGVTVVLVSHDVEFCAEHADLVGMFFDGKVTAVDPPRRFFSRSSFYTTAASRMSRGIFRNAVTAEDVALLYRRNREDAP